MGKVWFITGLSSGLGKAIAAEVVNNGDFVIGTFRSQAQTDAYNEINRNKAVGLTLDITDQDLVEKSCANLEEKYGPIDVLVNNAGFGLTGAIEETTLDEARSVFEANFFSVLRLTKMFLPQFRRRRKGHIIQISSHGGVKAFPGFGIYNASKFALEGFNEALAAEISPLGIKLTIVEPGPFRTNFAATSLRETSETIADYDPTAGVFKRNLRKASGNQEGDPVKAARAIYEVTKLDNPPLRLPLGPLAIVTLTAKIESLRGDINRNKAIAEAAIYLDS
jgi:short-subunit dehydrogenase